jgi:NADH-quinone oxidoreductase subunit K
MIITPLHYLVVAMAIFSVGSAGVLVRRDSVGVFMCIELMLLGVSLAFLTFSRMFNDFAGQVFVLVILAVAATEAAVGLAIMIIYHKTKKSILLKDVNSLKG